MEIKPLNQCIKHGCYSIATRGGLCSAHSEDVVESRRINDDLVKAAQQTIRDKANEMPDLTPKAEPLHQRRASDPSMSEKYPKYYKPVPVGMKDLDIYAICKIFSVQDPSGALHHALKKILLPGVRTGGKSRLDDIKEARDTLSRWIELHY